jgi:hypothetical protein
MVPSYSRKAISGQNNYLGKVTSHKIDEKKTGNRGSKSVLVTYTVKEQRVDGSWCIEKYLPMHLRCTLMGFERDYPIKIPSKQFNVNKFSTFNYPSHVINPWFFYFLFFIFYFLFFIFYFLFFIFFNPLIFIIIL